MHLGSNSKVKPSSLNVVFSINNYKMIKNKYSHEMSDEDKIVKTNEILKLILNIPLRDVKSILEGCILSVQSCSVLQDDYITQLDYPQ